MSKKIAKTGERPNISANFNEITQVRSAEAAAAASIETAIKRSEEQISNAHKESRVLYESTLSQLRTELEEDYIAEEAKVHQESNDIIEGAEAEAEQTRINASVTIPGAVDAITGGGA